MKKFTTLLMVFVLLVGISLTVFAAEDLKVALVTATGGLGDRSFNDAAYNGLKMARDRLGAEIKVVEPGSMADYEFFLRTMAKAGYDIVTAVGFDMKDAVTKVAPDFPETKFVIVNVLIDMPNVAVLRFKDHEGSFLAGALAGLMTETDTIGFVGGVDAPTIRNFMVGYTEGAQYTNSDVEVLTSFVGSFNDPAKGKEAALMQYTKGADIIFQAAGKTGEGVIAAANEQDKFAIGVDQNQDYIAPGNVLTSMVKHVEVGVFDICQAYKNDNFKAGVHLYGLKEGGVGLTDFEYTREIISEDYLTQLEEIKEKIIAGQIEVTDYLAQ